MQEWTKAYLTADSWHIALDGQTTRVKGMFAVSQCCTVVKAFFDRPLGGYPLHFRPKGAAPHLCEGQ